MAEHWGLHIPDMPVFSRVSINYPNRTSFDLGRGVMSALCENLVILPDEVHEAYGRHLLREYGFLENRVKPVVAENSFIWFIESLITGMIIADFKRAYTAWYRLIEYQSKSGIGLLLSFEPPYHSGSAIPRAVYDELRNSFPLGERGAAYFREGSVAPLVQWQPPNTVISFWQDDFVIPDFSAIVLGTSIPIEVAGNVASWKDQTVTTNGRVFNICYRHYDLVTGT